MKLKYFAYGSNLHPVRLMERVPSARLLEMVELSAYTFKFHMVGSDGSGKLNIVPTGSGEDRVFGAVYEFLISEKPLLDAYEGECYSVHDIEVLGDSGAHSCMTYIANEGFIDDALLPFTWYKELVAIGGAYLNFPEEYLSLIHKVASQEDENPERHGKNYALIDRMHDYSQ